MRTQSIYTICLRLNEDHYYYLNFFSFFHSNQPFSTKDSDNADSCAQTYKGAWWFKNCHGTNLNGLYHGGPHASYGDGVCWKDFKGFQYSLKRAEMKVKFINVGSS